jgi:glycosyltransferase involved in cell wall biosynthesis
VSGIIWNASWHSSVHFKKPGMKISVIIPVLNSARWLADALSSVTAQTYAPFEVLVIDGPSNDETPEIATSVPGVQYLKQPGKGMWNALNYGISVSTGDAIAFLSSDDVWHPDKLRLQTEWLSSHPETLVVFSHVRYLEMQEGSPLAASKPEIFDTDLPAYLTECLLARRQLFDLLGGFPEEYAITGDMDWFARLLDARIPHAILPQVLLTKRFHQTNLSTTDSSGKQYNHELLQIMRNKIVRRRSMTHDR